eukprot:scaffold2606_cov120-Isochrysis_galbana.AAC.7
MGESRCTTQAPPAGLYLQYNIAWEEVDSLRAPTIRAIPSGAVCHIEAAFDVACEALYKRPHADSAL